MFRVICIIMSKICRTCNDPLFLYKKCTHLPKTKCLNCEDDELIYDWRLACIFCMLYGNYNPEEQWDSLPELFESMALALVEIGFNHGYSDRVKLNKFNVHRNYRGIETLYKEGFNHGMLQRTHELYIITVCLSPWLCSDLSSLVQSYAKYNEIKSFI